MVIVMVGKENTIFLSGMMRYGLAIMDVTVFPSNVTMVNGALETMGLLLNMSIHTVGHVQMPFPHTNTLPQTIVKHRRLVEDNLMNAQKVDVSQTVALHIRAPEDGHAADKRGGVQNCLFATADAAATKWVCPQVIGPCSLVRVRDMIGYSEEARFGVTQRTEQILGLLLVQRFS